MSRRRTSAEESGDDETAEVEAVDEGAAERANADTLPPGPEPAPTPSEIPPEGPTLEEHAAELGTHPATLAAVKAYFRFGEGRKMSRAHYVAVLAHVENLKFQ